MRLPRALPAALALLGGLGRVASSGEPKDVRALVVEGDDSYARRAAGARGAVADPAPVEAAIAAYRQALKAAPDDDEAAYKLARALYFRAFFCGSEPERQKPLYDEAARLSQRAVDRIEGSLGGAKGPARIEALRKRPHAAEVYFWAAVSWGQWGLARGKLASARQGVAARVRDLSQTVVDVDPQAEEGGGYRVLGRLHDQAPRIPFVTGWVSGEKALANLRRSQAAFAHNPVTWFFLAEAILDNQPANKAEARELLERCATTPPRPEYLVEEAHYAQLARDRLSRLR